MTPAAEALARTVAAGLVELAREAGREAAREELAAGRAAAATQSRWVTPPAAHILTGVPTKVIREWASSGHVKSRLRNRSGTPKQPKYLVNVDEVAAAAERNVEVRALATSAPPTIDLQERAARLRARR